MKYLAYTVYVVTVLLISGFARANASTFEKFQQAQQQTQYEMPVAISQVALDQATGQLIVAGSLPNPCFIDPSALLTQDSHNPNVLVIRLSSPVPMNACVSRVKYFNSNVELVLLAQFSRVEIDAKATYLLKVDGSDFETQIPGSALLNK